MVDHLPLPPGQELSSRRRPPAPTGGRSVNRKNHAAKLSSDLAQASEQVDQETDSGSDPRLVLKLDAVTRLTSGPLRGLDLLQLGESQGWTYAVLSDRDSRRLLMRLLGEYSSTDQDSASPWNHPQTWAQLLDNIDGISVYGETDRRDPELEELSFESAEIVDIIIWPAQSASAAVERIDAVRDLLLTASAEGLIAEVLSFDPRPQTTSLRAQVDMATLNRLLRESWVERIRPPLRTPFSRRTITRAAIPRGLSAPTNAPIGILDGVVSVANPLLTDRVIDSREFPEGHVFSAADVHGTAVASVCVWGSLDFAVTGNPAPPSSPIFAARILDVDPNRHDLYIPGQDHTTLEAAIRWLVNDKRCRIVSLSVNKPHAEDRLLRSEVCATLDALVRELQFVLIVSSGNRSEEPAGGWLGGYPGYLEDDDARVADPADAALAITVGSIAHREVPSGVPTEHLLSVARTGDPSPFGRSGPVRGRTREGMAKPEFSHDGGNMVHDHTLSMAHTNDPGVSVVVGTPPIGGQFLTTEVGSSYAAPAVAYEISRIAARYPDASANMLRTLVALSARRTEISPLLGIDVTRTSLYGVPRAERILESGGPVAILTVEDEMSTNSVVVHELPIPYEFAQGGSSRSLRVALAFDPPTLRSRREYVAGWMSVELVRGLTYEEVCQRYERQPSRAEVEADSTLTRLDLPSGRLRPVLTPTSRQLASNTLIRRDYVDQGWDPDDENYFLIVSHNLSPWTERQRREYGKQSYSLAVQLIEHDRVDLDLHALVRARLLARARGRVRRSAL